MLQLRSRFGRWLVVAVALIAIIFTAEAASALDPQRTITQ
jgi:hypothetical protein